MAWMKRVVGMVGMVVALGLGASTALAADPEYALTVKAPPVKVGEKAPLELVFAPQGPWKWNKEYPAKLELTAPGVTADKSLLKQLEQDFKETDKLVTASFLVTAAAAGTTQGTVKGKIGLCDDKVCIIRKVEVPVTLTAE